MNPMSLENKIYTPVFKRSKSIHSVNFLFTNVNEVSEILVVLCVMYPNSYLNISNLIQSPKKFNKKLLEQQVLDVYKNSRYIYILLSDN